MRPIDADELRNVIMSSNLGEYTGLGEFCKLDALEIINQSPTIDVKPVIHAHWIEKNDWIACSNCNHEILDDYYEKRYKYIACPYCSAEMNGGVEDAE